VLLCANQCALSLVSLAEEIWDTSPEWCGGPLDKTPRDEKSGLVNENNEIGCFGSDFLTPSEARLKTVADLLATDPGQDKDLRKFGKKLGADFKLSSGAGSGVG
jgi:hypothetical protein